MEVFFGLLANLFGPENIELEETKDNKIALDAWAASQQSLYNKFVESALNIAYRNANDSGYKTTLPSHYAVKVLEWLQREVINNTPQVLIQDGKIIASSSLPFINEADTTAVVEFLNYKPTAPRKYSEALRLGEAAAACVLVIGKNLPSYENTLIELINSREGFLIFAAVSEYSAYKVLHGIKNNEVNIIRSDLVSSIDEAKNNISAYNQRLLSISAEQRNLIDNSSNYISQIEIQAQNTNLEIEKTKNRLENFENTIREELRFDRTRISWKTRYKEARFGFWASIFLIAIFTGTTFGVSYRYAIPFIEALSALEVKTASDSISVALAHQFGRLLVFSVPVIVYLWVFRALMRFFMRSMLLMDDARQRQTMLDTYFLLSEKGRADERDRPMILWSLFRQTPGHGSDGIEPPDFTEVINAGLKRMGDKG